MPNVETPSLPLATVPLLRPVTFGTDTYTELVFRRRLKAKDFFGIRLAGMKFDDYLLLISRAVNIPTMVLEEMDSADFTAACTVIDSFLSNGPETSKAA